MKRNKILKNISMVLSFIFIFTSFAFADSDVVVTLGKNLDDAQRKEILELFKVDENKTEIIEVNNQEEREYLEGVATEEQLGKITMSSAYVELLEENSGIEVETHNISWVTKEMYANALVTAGVKNAKVIAAAPFPVSGTGALTGILKAFEQATGQDISEEQKKVANEEVVRVGELGEDVGKDKAAELVKKVKEEIIDKLGDAENKKVFYEIWHDPLQTAGPGSFMDEMISLSGGDNIASDTDEAYALANPALVNGGWISVDVPLSSFPGLSTKSNLAQIVYVTEGTNPNAVGNIKSIYIDNIYFHN